MTTTQLPDATPDTAMSLRNEPVQARSTARLAGLLDAAAAVIDEIGYERLTTAMVAERAGASIGTVYRYFPDRIAVLQALGARNLDRVLTAVGEEVRSPRHSDWFTALSSAFAVLETAFRTEPGFRSLRVGDVIDLRPVPTERPYKSLITDEMMNGLVERFSVEDTAETRFTFEICLEVSDALAVRAFSRDPQGDTQYLEAARDVVYGMLVKHFGEPTA